MKCSLQKNVKFSLGQFAIEASMLQAAVEAIDKAKSEDRTRGFEEFGNAWNGLSESLAKTMMEYLDIWR